MGFEITVRAPGTPMVVSAPVVRLIISTAPTGYVGGIGAEGTAAYPMPVVAGITMLVVTSGSGMLPLFDSVTVLMTCTVLLLGSKASNVARVGERTIRPGVLPAEISLTAGTVSLPALMIFKPPNVNEELISCEARTRVLSLLGGL